MEVITKSAEETKQFGEKFATDLMPGSIVLLYGDLGSGKTTFAQGMAKGLGITKRLISPTFIIIRTYTLKTTAKNAKLFYHIDLYRAEAQSDIEGLGLDEIVNDKEAIVVIEWPERMEKLTKNSTAIKFQPINEGERKITVEN